MTLSSPQTAASFRTAGEAETVAQWLQQHDIHAIVVGNFTSEYVTETNTEVRVVVNASELAAARQLIATYQADDDVDWSQVDCGDPTDVAEDEREDRVPPSTGGRQFPLAMLFVLQLFIAVTCLVIRLPYRDLGDLVLPVLMASLVMVGIISLTIKLASNLNRLTETWKVLGISCATIGVMWVLTAWLL